MAKPFVILAIVFAVLTVLSVCLLAWQFIAAMCFPLHRRLQENSARPAVTILKPLKGADENTARCLRSWFEQQHGGEVQLLFGVADAADPVCDVVEKLLAAFPDRDAQLVICAERLGLNAKVSTLVQLMRHAKHAIIGVSDADVFVPRDFLTNALATLQQRQAGLVNCFYQIANASTFAMRLEAVSVNADFWSQVLQANTLHRQDFALGAVMLAPRDQLEAIGGFAALVNYLADDFQLGRRIAKNGGEIALCPVVVECWESPKGTRAVWEHQLRWARTIRVSRPAGYFFSLLGNVTLWSLLLAIFGAGAFGFVPLFGMSETGRLYFPLFSEAAPDSRYALLTGYDVAFAMGVVAILLRMVSAGLLAARLTRRRKEFNLALLAPIRDLVQAVIWAAAFLGHTITWGGRRFRVVRNGRLQAED